MAKTLSKEAIDPTTGMPILIAALNSVAPPAPKEASAPLPGWRLGNGSLFRLPTYENDTTNAYAGLAAQLQDARNMYGQGAGRFATNAAGRYAFGGPKFGTLNPNAASGTGLLGGGGPPPGSQGPPPGPQGPPPGPQGPPPPSAGGLLGGGLPPPAAPQGVPFPGWAENWKTPSAANNTAEIAYMAMAGNGNGVIKALGTEQGNQMINAYQGGGQNYRPWLNSLASRGLMEPPAAQMPQWAAEGLGSVVNGKWQWAPGKGFDSASTSVY